MPKAGSDRGTEEKEKNKRRGEVQQTATESGVSCFILRKNREETYMTEKGNVLKRRKRRYLLSCLPNTTWTTEKKVRKR